MSSEELKKEWESSFEQEFGIHFSPSELQFAKSFISSLLAKQQEGFVKCLPEEPKGKITKGYATLSEAYDYGYHRCIADIKSKLK